MAGSHRLLGRSGTCGGLSVCVTEQHTTAAPSARQRLRAVHERQLDVLGHIDGLRVKAARLEVALAGVDAQQRSALGELAEIAGVELAVELTGVPASKVRE